MKTRAILFVAGASFALGGCGIEAKINAREATQQSEAAYKACLATNPSTPQNCEGARLAWQADLQQYEAFSAGVRPGSTMTVQGSTP